MGGRVCPWAYLGKRCLEKALADPVIAGLGVELVWRPYRIDPTAPVSAMPVQDAVGNGRHLAQAVAQEGFGPEWGAAWRVDSHDAHRDDSCTRLMLG
ncbi:DsbA family protein [Streptomyces sp. NPDC046862]|uniref:DsbA family protein n=1 Tax=Streptomyces sp. NPDC046862 TaxID=3154603 RepID=UPI0034561AE5